MSISTLDGALAGMQPLRPIAKAVTPTLVAGRPHSLWYLGGAPGAGAADTTTNGGVARSSTSAQVTGQISHTDPGAGNAYLARLTATATQGGLLLLCDRLWDCGNANGSTLSPTSLTAQTINSAALPARDNAGSINGDGVLIGMEISSATGSGAGNAPTLGYTNQAGTASRSAGLIDSYVASSAIGAFYRFALQAGDTGVKSIQTFTNTATMTSGQQVLVAYRILACLELPGALIPNAIDALTSGFPRLYNGVVPFLLFIPNTTTASLITGSYTETQG